MAFEVFDDVAFYWFLQVLLCISLIPYSIYRVYSWCVHQKIHRTRSHPCVSEIPAYIPIQKLITEEDKIERTFSLRNIFFAGMWVLFVLLLIQLPKWHNRRMTNFEPFEILEIPKGSNAGQIKRAYRKMSLKYHPDKCTRPPLAMAAEKCKDMFIMVRKAYETLTDEATKENYEKFGNPDGYQGTMVTIGLPSWLTFKENETLVLMIYFSALVTLVALVYTWWNHSSKFHKSGVYKQSIDIYWRFIKNHMTHRHLLDILAASAEFRILDVKIVTAEKLAAVRLINDEIVQLISKGRPQAHFNPDNPLNVMFQASYVRKAVALMHCHLMGLAVPAELRDEYLFVLQEAPRLLDVMIDMTLSRERFWVQGLQLIQLKQAVIQGVWWKESKLKQLPHWTPAIDKQLRKSKFGDMLGLSQLAPAELRETLSTVYSQSGGDDASNLVSDLNDDGSETIDEVTKESSNVNSPNRGGRHTGGKNLNKHKGGGGGSNSGKNRNKRGRNSRHNKGNRNRNNNASKNSNRTHKQAQSNKHNNNNKNAAASAATSPKRDALDQNANDNDNDNENNNENGNGNDGTESESLLSKNHKSEESSSNSNTVSSFVDVGPGASGSNASGSVPASDDSMPAASNGEGERDGSGGPHEPAQKESSASSPSASTLSNGPIAPKTKTKDGGSSAVGTPPPPAESDDGDRKTKEDKEALPAPGVLLVSDAEVERMVKDAIACVRMYPYIKVDWCARTYEEKQILKGDVVKVTLYVERINEPWTIELDTFQAVNEMTPPEIARQNRLRSLVDKSAAAEAEGDDENSGEEGGGGGGGRGGGKDGDENTYNYSDAHGLDFVDNELEDARRLQIARLNAPVVHVNKFPFRVREKWMVMLVDKSIPAVIDQRAIPDLSGLKKLDLHFQVQRPPGKYPYMLVVKCDSYLGADKHCNFDIVVSEEKKRTLEESSDEELDYEIPADEEEAPNPKWYYLYNENFWEMILSIFVLYFIYLILSSSTFGRKYIVPYVDLFCSYCIYPFTTRLNAKLYEFVVSPMTSNLLKITGFNFFKWWYGIEDDVHADPNNMSAEDEELFGRAQSDYEHFENAQAQGNWEES